MRPIVVFLTLCALAAPLAAFAAPRVAGDGTLAVRDLNGRFVVYAKGGIVGRCDRCVLRVNDWREEDSIDPRIFGAKAFDEDGDGDVDRYQVRDGRWKIIGGSFHVVVSSAIDADISVVGKGRGSIRGTAGSYSVNGGDFFTVPTEITPFTLRAAALSP